MCKGTIVDFVCLKRQLLVWYGCSVETFKTQVFSVVGEEFEMNNFDDSDGKTISVELSSGSMLFVCWTRNKDIPMLVHELHHGINNMLRYMGIVEDQKNDELSSYYLEYALRVVLDSEPKSKKLSRKKGKKQ